MRFLPIVLLLFFTSTIFAQSKNPAYQIYNAKGKNISFKKWVRKIRKTDVVLFGELHDNPIAHWLELELVQNLTKEIRLVLGAEMLETDNQEMIDRYIDGTIGVDSLKQKTRLWLNYETDYQPLVDFARNQQIPFVATNIPRRYASMVYRKGLNVLESLPDEEKEWMATLPIAYDPHLPGYQKMLSMSGGHGGEYLPQAQAIKDATMAEFILKNRIPGSLFIHFNGRYHSDFHEGILWYMRRIDPELDCVTISTVTQKNVRKLEKEHRNRADFIIVVPENMTRTY